MAPKKAIISDSNEELINVYEVVRDSLDELLSIIKVYRNEEEFYYKVRNQNPSNLGTIERAARILYLNKTCYNGLYRVNKNDEFNVPFGRYKRPTIYNEKLLRKASNILRNAVIVCRDYRDVLSEFAGENDFIFLDPPYIPISKYSDFKRYTKEFFYEEDHLELAKAVKKLYNLGCYVLLTNSNHPLVYELYKEFEIEVHNTKRFINSKADKRVGEDLIVIADPPKRNKIFYADTKCS